MKDIYVKFEGPTLNGESRDHQHSGWIEAHAWHHGMHQPKSGTASTAGGHTSERCEHLDMVLSKDMDVVSPQLYQHCSGGTTFSKVTIEFYRADGEGNRVKYMDVQLKNAIISDIYPAVKQAGIPTEELNLKYAAIQWHYTQQKVGGGAGGSSHGAWSLTKNDKTFAA